MVVYLVKVEETDLYKIGYTSQSPRERVVAMQTGCPHRLKLVGAWKGSEHDEKLIHEDLESAHVRGEWFELDPDRVVGLFCSMANGTLHGGKESGPAIIPPEEPTSDNTPGEVVIDEVLQRIIGRFGSLEDQHVLFPSNRLMEIGRETTGKEDLSAQKVWSMVRPFLKSRENGRFYKGRTNVYRGLAWEGEESNQVLQSWFED